MNTENLNDRSMMFKKEKKSKLIFLQLSKRDHASNVTTCGLRGDGLPQWPAHAKHSLADGMPISLHAHTWWPPSTTQMIDDNGHNRLYGSSEWSQIWPSCCWGASGSGCIRALPNQRWRRQEGRRYRSQHWWSSLRTLASSPAHGG